MSNSAVTNISSRSSRSVTLDDVAKLAGVSPITVSRVLNHPEKVAPKTREKIQQAIARTGYVPNLLAGGLASKKSRLIAAVVPSVANSVYAETIKFFTETMRNAGYQVILGESGHDEIQEELLVSAVLSRRPDGVLLTGINHSTECRKILMGANIPIVETWDLTPTPLDVAVGFSHRRVGASVAEYLWEKGYRKIGVVTATDPRAMIRQKTFIEALKKHDIENVAISYVTPPTSFKSGREGLAALLDGGFSEGAVFFSSDTLAQGALAEIQARNIVIPDQLALIGFGDQPYAAHTFPALTTVRFDRVLIGQQAAKALLNRIDGMPVNEHVIDVGFEIVDRETT